MTHRIIVEGPTPHETIATLSALAAPHVINGVKLQMQQQLQNDMKRDAAVAVDRDVQPKTGPQELPADTRVDIALPITKPGEPCGGEAETVVVAPVVAAAAEPVVEKPARRPRATKRDTTKDKTAVNIDDPHGKAHTYETVGEALEGMCDMLDLCTTVAEVDGWVDKHEGLIAGAGQPGEVFRGIVNGFKTELQSTDTSDFPATDVVGEKKTAAQPVEMSLDSLEPPAGLKRPLASPKKDDGEALTISDVRHAFMALCETKDSDAGRALLNRYKVARVNELPDSSWVEFVGECRKGSPADDVQWGVAMLHATERVSAKYGK